MSACIRILFESNLKIFVTRESRISKIEPLKSLLGGGFNHLGPILSSYRNQPIYVMSKSVVWFLYDESVDIKKSSVQSVEKAGDEVAS